MDNIISIIASLGCLTIILKTILRIIWLYYPGFLTGSFLGKHKTIPKWEMLGYYICGITVLAYYIVKSLDKLNVI
jgi:hypothetical protein